MALPLVGYDFTATVGIGLARQSHSWELTFRELTVRAARRAA